MIQDCTRVQHLARPPPHLPHHSGFAHCSVPCLLKNPAHKQDRWLKNNLHKEKKQGRGWRTGRKEGGAGLGTETCILSLAGQWRLVVEAVVRLAFNLCKAPGVWVCHVKVFFHTQWSQKEEEKETPCPMRRGESCEGNKPKRNTQSSVWQAPVLLAILSPKKLKTGH